MQRVYDISPIEEVAKWNMQRQIRGSAGYIVICSGTHDECHAYLEKARVVLSENEIDGLAERITKGEFGS